MNSGTPKNNNLGVFYTNLGKNINKGLNQASETITNVTNNISNAVNNVVTNTPKVLNETITSLLPFESNVKANVKTPNVNIKTPNVSSTSSNTGTSYTWALPILVFIVVAVIFIVIFVKFQDKINAGINNIIQQIRDAFNRPTTPPKTESTVTTINETPTSPQEEQVIATEQQSQRKATNIIDKVLPMGKPEVFNVSENEYSYYDAEPLCRALGAELATYDQVKEAWSKGADWCNYGWVKGQAAVYPTQNETWEKIQSGPEENRNSCGVPGLNGGYFDNPEMKFGVNCYGPKPSQSGHSQEDLMKDGKLPLTVPALEVEKKTQEFKKQLDSIAVLPFSNDKWSNN